MIGLDTNTLVRYLTQDEPGQYAKVAAAFESAVDRGEPLVINIVVLCELVWVLDRVYEYSRDEIANALELIFATTQFEIDRLDDARRALDDFRSTKAGFSDALIGRINRSLGAPRTMTFDRDLKGLDTFHVI